jgi:pimeloyl-ACP methyl ester carboxylesterase
MRRWLACLMFAVLCAVGGARGAFAGAPLKHDFFTTADGVKLHYMTCGTRGTWVVLMHGYTDNAERMWFDTGIVAALAKNHRVLALDSRNHGRSDKPEPYGIGRAEDAIELMDRLGIQKAHFHGYAMGGAMMLRLMDQSPERFLSASFGGSGVAEADETLRAKAAALDPPMPEPKGADAEAFARYRNASEARRKAGNAPAATSAPRPPVNIDLKKINFPVLSIIGEYDRPYSRTQRLWRELNRYQSVILPKKNHFTAIMIGGPMPPEYIESLVTFIDASDPR